jgi:hypothetical protein
MAQFVAQKWRPKGAVRHNAALRRRRYGAAHRPWVEMAHVMAQFMAHLTNRRGERKGSAVGTFGVSGKLTNIMSLDLAHSVHQPPRDIGEAHHAAITAKYAAGQHGLEPTATDWRDAVLAICAAVAGEASSARYIGPTRFDREIWRVTLCGVPVRVVYQPADALIVTVLPRHILGLPDVERAD